MPLETATKSGLLHGGLSDALKQLQNFATPDPISLAAVHDETPSFYAFIVYTPEQRVVLFGRRLNPSNFARRGTIRFVVGNEATLQEVRQRTRGNRQPNRLALRRRRVPRPQAGAAGDRIC